MCCIIFSELKKINAKFFGKVRIVAQSKFSRNVWFQVFISQRIFPKTYLQHKVYQQSSVRFSTITQNFSVIISINFFGKNRRKAFGVSSENMLHTTFCSYKKLRTSFTNNYKYKQNIDSTITFSDKKPYLAISCNCCCRQYFLWRILFNTNDLGSFFRQFGSFLKMYDIYLKMYDIILLMYDINLKMYDIFLLMYAIYLKMYSIILLMYRSFLN